MTRTTTDPRIEATLRIRALARWENEGGRVPLATKGGRPPAGEAPASQAAKDTPAGEELSTAKKPKHVLEILL
jgi:hypothetical protein